MARHFETSSWAASLRARLRRSDGFTLVELLVSITVLTVGILSLTTVLSSSNASSGVAERQQAEVNRAQREIERIASIPYSQIALTSAPTNVANSRDPNYYVTSTGGSCPSYQWNQAVGQIQGPTNTDPLVINGCGGVSGGTVQSGAQAWSDSAGHSGSIEDFITWVTDTKCAPGCPATNDFKRITVAITNGQGAPYKPILISATIADPHANGGTNPVGNPGVNCTDSQGQTISCTSGLGSGSSITVHPVNSCSGPPTADSIVHPTIAPLNLLPPTPDCLSTSPPTGTTCYNYSTDLGSPDPCSRVLNPDAACGGILSTTDNSKGEFWTTAQQSSSVTLTGSGGTTLYSKTANGQAASVTLCLAVYDVPPSSYLNLITLPPIRLGVVAYTLAQWPTVLTPISFTFNFLGSGTAVLPTGDRIGIRVWVAAGGVPIQLAYDGASVDSQFQLVKQ